MNPICIGCPGVLTGDCEDCTAATWNQPERDDWDEDYAYGERMQYEPSARDLDVARCL